MSKEHMAPRPFALMPAVDIQDGAAVRLVQGAPGSETDYGDPVPIKADEIPVFWACGVTPQAVISAAKVPFAITHAPGLMLVTDLKNKQLAVL